MVDEDHVDIHRQPQQNLDGQVQSGAALHRELRLLGSPHPRRDDPVKRHRVLFGLDERPQPIVLGRLLSPAGRDLGKPPQTVPGGLRLSLGSAAEQWAESWLQRNFGKKWTERTRSLSGGGRPGGAAKAGKGGGLWPSG